MKSLAISGSLRESNGKSAAKALREQDNILCVLYGGKEPIHFSAPTSSFKKLVYNHEVHIVELSVDGKTYKAIMKDIQFHPVTDEVLHIDFLQLDESKAVEIEIPVKIVGNSVGVRAGGKLVTKVRKLKVKSLPAKLPDFIEINIENLEIGKAIRVGDLKIEGVELLDAANNVITSVKTTRAVETTAPGAPAKK
jgi:large subunit ribosomal protein L25